MPMPTPTTPRGKPNPRRTRVQQLLSQARGYLFDPNFRHRLVVVILAGVAFGCTLILGLWTRACANSQCPAISVLTDYDPQQASQILAADGRVITNLGSQRRIVVPI